MQIRLLISIPALPSPTNKLDSSSPTSEESIDKGEHVIVKGIDGFTLRVKKIDQ